MNSVTSWVQETPGTPAAGTSNTTLGRISFFNPFHIMAVSVADGGHCLSSMSSPQDNVWEPFHKTTPRMHRVISNRHVLALVYHSFLVSSYW